MSISNIYRAIGNGYWIGVTIIGDNIIRAKEPNMKNLFSNVKNFFGTKKEVNQDYLCALRLSYNNFEEEASADSVNFYRECISKTQK